MLIRCPLLFKNYLVLLAIMLNCPFLWSQTYVPGQSYFGNLNYVEYQAGNLPLILSAPHGGHLEPKDIPDRDCSGCSYVIDFNTQELARAVAAAIHLRTGCYPHLVINRLHRSKLDANRDLPEAADGNAIAGQAWGEYQAWLDTANAVVSQTFSKGLFIDLHGHGHAVQRLEIGYLLTKNELQLSDNELNTNAYVTESSIRNLAQQNITNASHADLLRGEQSLGTRLSDMSYPAVPSATDPFPDSTELYFNGGYNTDRHGSRSGGQVDAIQIECNRIGIRDNATNLARFADSLSIALLDYLETHYFGPLNGAWCNNAVTTSSIFENTAVQVYPNPYCTSIFINPPAAKSDYEVSVYDFYGNLKATQVLAEDATTEIRLANPGNVWLVFRKNGRVIGMQTALQYCP